jgi:hypothetical protein
MSRCWRKLILALPLLAALPLAAVPEQPAGNPPAPADGRRDPTDAALLRQEARAFLALPAERRERMIKLDEDIQQAGSPARQQHLRDVLRRYADWLDRLPEHERRLITEAPTKKIRLRRIRELREEQWLRRQPKAVRNGLAALRAVAAVGLTLPRFAGAELRLAGPLLAPAPDGQPFLIARLRQQERRRRHEWQIALRHWDDLGKRPLPTRLSDFTDEVRKYVAEYLMPMLSPEERALLKAAEGQLRFPYVLVHLADQHPPALPGEYGPKTFKELPTDVQERIKKFVMVKGPKAGGEPTLKKKILAADGRWPKFAIEVTRMAALAFKGKGIKLSARYEFWPAHLSELSPEVQKFVKEKLPAKLNGDEKTLLARSQGKWPDYPQTIQELATRHGLQVPWQTLPGLRKNWDFYRIGSRRSSEQLPGLGEVGLVLLEPAPRAPAAVNAVFARLPVLPALSDGPFWPRREDRR